jgi:uncharacterized membrane protein YfcA
LNYVLLTLLIIGLAGFLQGAIGFGFGILAVTLLSTFSDIREASVLVALSGLSINIALWWRLRQHFQWKQVAPLILSTIIGVPLGVLFLKYSSAAWLQLVLGGWLVVTSLYTLIPKTHRKRWPTIAGVPSGILAGIFQGAFAMGGPAAIPYVSSQQFTKFRYSATLQALFLTSSLTRLLCLGATGLFTIDKLGVSVLGAVVAIGCSQLGLKVLDRIPELELRKGTAVTLFMLGLRYIYIF